MVTILSLLETKCYTQNDCTPCFPTTKCGQALCSCSQMITSLQEGCLLLTALSNTYNITLHLGNTTASRTPFGVLSLIIPGSPVPGPTHQMRHLSGRLGKFVSPLCTAASTGLAEDSTMSFWGHFKWEKLPSPPSLLYSSALTLFSIPYSILFMNSVFYCCVAHYKPSLLRTGLYTMALWAASMSRGEQSFLGRRSWCKSYFQHCPGHGSQLAYCAASTKGVTDPLNSHTVQDPYP